MPRDIEELLRESLHTRAQDVEPSPQTWTRVQSRIRRGRTVRLALAGVTTAAAVLVALAVVPGLIDRPDVVFPPGDDPAPQPEHPAAPPADCTTPTDVAAVYSSQGDLWKWCVGGGEHLLYGSSDIDEDPAVSPDGVHVLFTSRQDPAPVIGHVYLSTGASTVLGGGELPAFAPDGRVAWVQQADGEGAFIVGGELFSEPEFEIAVDGRVRRLVWDTVDDHLLYETEDGTVWVARPETGEQLRIDDPERSYFSPAVAPDGTIAVISVDEEGSYELGYLDRGVLTGGQPGYTPVAELSMDGFSDPFLAPAGYVWAERVGDMEHRWVPGDQLAWLVGDGVRTDLLREDGELFGLAFEGMAQDPAVNPAVALGDRAGGEPLHLEPQSVPHNVEVTRQRIYAAARAGDFGGLHALMDPEFSWLFGGDLDRDEGIEHLRANPELLDVIAGLLELPYGVIDPVEPEYFVWPWVFTDPEANWPEFRDRLVAAVGEAQVAEYEEHGEYLGWRIGIDRDGVWRYFIAGD